MAIWLPIATGLTIFIASIANHLSASKSFHTITSSYCSLILGSYNCSYIAIAICPFVYGSMVIIGSYIATC